MGEEYSDFGSRLESLSLDILGKISDKYVTGTATSAQPTAPADPIPLAIPSATNQSISFFQKYKMYLIAGGISLILVAFLWKKAK